jgi:hypothetical protein
VAPRASLSVQEHLLKNNLEPSNEVLQGLLKNTNTNKTVKKKVNFINSPENG